MTDSKKILERIQNLRHSWMESPFRLWTSCYEEAWELVQKAIGVEGLPFHEDELGVYKGFWNDLDVRNVSFEPEYIDNEVVMVVLVIAPAPTKIELISKRDELTIYSYSNFEKE